MAYNPPGQKDWRDRNRPKVLAQRKRYYQKTSGALRTQERWTPEDISRILDVNRPSDRELAKELNRSMKSISVKRTKVLSERTRRKDNRGSAGRE
jgi:hypothetical protein